MHDNSLQASSLVHVPIQGDDGDKENISPNIFSMNKSNDENECLLDTETEVQANSVCVFMIMLVFIYFSYLSICIV